MPVPRVDWNGFCDSRGAVFHVTDNADSPTTQPIAMSHSTRRIFLASSIAALAAPSLAHAATHVEEADDTAVALGYKHDTKLVDQKKYPNHAAQQHCGDCAFWQGAQSDAWAGCAMFGRKQVAANGWCGAFAKKPG